MARRLHSTPTPASLPELKRRPAVLTHDAVTAQPGTGIGRVLLEPRARRTQPERIAPGVHVLEHSRATEHAELIRQQDLQVAHRAFLLVVAAGVAIEAGAACG